MLSNTWGTFTRGYLKSYYLCGEASQIGNVNIPRSGHYFSDQNMKDCGVKMCARPWRICTSNQNLFISPPGMRRALVEMATFELCKKIFTPKVLYKNFHARFMVSDGRYAEGRARIWSTVQRRNFLKIM